jgi:hypothetical protein
MFVAWQCMFVYLIPLPPPLWFFCLLLLTSKHRLAPITAPVTPSFVSFRYLYFVRVNALMMDAISTSETSASFYQAKRGNVAEDSHLQYGTFSSWRCINCCSCVGLREVQLCQVVISVSVNLVNKSHTPESLCPVKQRKKLEAFRLVLCISFDVMQKYVFYPVSKFRITGATRFGTWALNKHLK